MRDPDWLTRQHLLVGTVEIYMYDTNSYRKENTKALAAVRRMLAVMRLLGEKASALWCRDTV